MKNISRDCIRLLIVLFLISHFSLLISKAEASALSLSLDPSVIEINALPPSVATSTLSIQNKSENLVELQILLVPFKAKSENGELQYLSSPSPFLTQNIQLLDSGIPIEGIALGPKQKKDLTLNVNTSQGTPASTRPPATSSNQSQANQAGVAGEVGRDHYFSIIFVSQNTATPVSTSSLGQLGIASNILLSIGAKEIPDGVIEEFSSGLFYESGPVPFTLRIKNNGKQIIKPKGEILIKNMFGQNIGRLDLMKVNILSESVRAIPNTAYIQELISEDTEKNSNLSFQNPKLLWNEDFLLGFYTATLNISLSDEGPSFTKTIHFFAFPLMGMIVIVIVLIGAIVVVNRVRAHIKK
ncbi:MAG: hypothetical protein HYW62_01720 [Candidatus Levybacteria bacterium]|nr:hypothetical protein [Candidatus Levybacteria bacterium]